MVCVVWNMAGAIEQIEHDLALLEQSLEAIAQEFQTLYGHYLAELGKAARQQLIMTSFHVCTQGYPERFLRLSLSQRQQLQQGLRELANQVQMQLSHLLETSAAIASAVQLELDDDALNDDGSESVADARASSGVIPPAEPMVKEFLQGQHQVDVPLTTSQPQFDPANYLSLDDSVGLDPDVSEPSVVSDTESAAASHESGEEKSDDQQTNEAASLIPHHHITDETADTADSPDSSDDDSDEEEEDSDEGEGESEFISELLLDQQALIEESIVEILRNVSHAANRLIQQSGVLPKKLPASVLEAAAKADLSTEAVGPPNLLNLIIETGDNNDEQSQITYIMAIRLRVSEIEFSNPALSALRAKLRDFSGRLNRLDQEFDKKYRERAIAEAESVWRSSWFDG